MKSLNDFVEVNDTSDVEPRASLFFNLKPTISRISLQLLITAVIIQIIRLICRFAHIEIDILNGLYAMLFLSLLHGVGFFTAFKAPSKSLCIALAVLHGIGFLIT